MNKPVMKKLQQMLNDAVQAIEGFEKPIKIHQNLQRRTLNSVQNKGYSKSSIGNEKEKLPQPAYDFIRRYSPLFSVDAVLVPAGKRPSVLLLKRGYGSVAAGKWYTVGGRLGKRNDIIGALRERIKTETNLDAEVLLKDIIGLGLPVYPPDNKEKGKRDYDVFTPDICFACKIGSAEKIKEKIKASGGNTDWKIFTAIDESWDKYVIIAVARAWDRIYGKGWRKGVSRKILRMMEDYEEFVPLTFSP